MPWEFAKLDHPAPPRVRSEGGQRTRQTLLDAATELFAQKGYAGANVNEIVERAGTTKPMLYYHFGSKEGLFAAVLESVYAGMRAIEGSLHLDKLPPDAGMRRLVEITFDYHAAHPDWIRLISVANIHEAEHIKTSSTIAARNSAIVDVLRDLLARGAAAGMFRANIDALHLHMLINATCFYRISNRHTWKVIFGRDLFTSKEAAKQRAMLVEAVMRLLAV